MEEDKKPNNPSAFPVNEDPHSGMTLRDYFAAKFMASLILEERFCGMIENDAKFAYKMADAMLKEREK